MIGYILGGLGVLGLFGIRNALQVNAAANLYTAVKDKMPSEAASLPEPWWWKDLYPSRLWKANEE
jgi:hypothetical protein